MSASGSVMTIDWSFLRWRRAITIADILSTSLICEGNLKRSFKIRCVPDDVMFRVQKLSMVTVAPTRNSSLHPTVPAHAVTQRSRKYAVSRTLWPRRRLARPFASISVTVEPGNLRLQLYCIVPRPDRDGYHEVVLVPQ